MAIITLGKFRNHVSPEGDLVKVAFVSGVNRFNNQVRLVLKDIDDVTETLPVPQLWFVKHNVQVNDALVITKEGILKIPPSQLDQYPVQETVGEPELRLFVFRNTGFMSDEIVRLNAIDSVYVVSSKCSNHEPFNGRVPVGNYRSVLVKAPVSVLKEIQLKVKKTPTYVSTLTDQVFLSTW